MSDLGASKRDSRPNLARLAASRSVSDQTDEFLTESPQSIMRPMQFLKWSVTLALVAPILILLFLRVRGPQVAAPTDVAASQEAAEVLDGTKILTRGPVHEAFATTVNRDPEPGMNVTKGPPYSIEELPPEQKPDGENVAWIPGYWAWDDDREDFLWISGIWRALPPGKQWIPGYWSEADQSFQWTAGYWADAKLQEIEYLPQPPEPIEQGPNIAAPSEEDVSDGTEILTRGPVHEAFAATVNRDPEPGMMVTKYPPYSIEELPPEQKPDGENVAWIPGYWAWDDDREDFLWISGIWRALPPGRQWIPGYWSETDQSFQWIAGYWADAKLQEIEYLPQPPESIEQGPNIAAPSEEDVWIPGCWVWHQNRYAWRPGYWVAAQPNWIWIPSSYCWAPNGYVFIDGYWDYAVARRGILFAPVYFNANVYGRQGFVYSPQIVINVNVFANQLFLRPRYQHYYFGDYYASNYLTAGFYPWFSVQSRGFGYDPVYAHQHWMNRQNPQWSQTIQANYRNRVDREDARPPRTFAAQQASVKSGDSAKSENLLVAMSLNQAVKVRLTTEDGSKTDSGPIRFQKIDRQTRQKFAAKGQQIQEFRTQRKKSEVAGGPTSKPDGVAQQPESPKAGKPGKTGRSTKVKLAPSPIVAEAIVQAGREQAPPKVPESPKPDVKVEAKARKSVTDNDKPELRSKRPGTTAEPKTPKGKPKVDGKPERPKRKPEMKPERPERKSETKPETPEQKPEMKPEPPEQKPETKPEPPERKSETKPERPEQKPETKPEPPEQKPETKPERKPKSKVPKKGTARTEGGVESRREAERRKPKPNP